MDFELIDSITGIEPIAAGRGIRDRKRLQRVYGKGRWRKLRGVATVRLAGGTIHTAEIHWVRGARDRTKGTQTEAASARLKDEDQSETNNTVRSLPR